MSSDCETLSLPSEARPKKLGKASSQDPETGADERLGVQLATSPTSPTSTRALSTLLVEVDAKLLRGVSLSECLAGWGKHWRSSTPDSMYDLAAREYKLSKKVLMFHHFLSHDWQTSRWAKMCTMLIYFNSGAAGLAALLCSIAVGLWRESVSSPGNIIRAAYLGSFLPYVAFLFFFCFWQRVRSLLGRPLMVFLDRLCIAQHDPSLKEKLGVITAYAVFLFLS